jgi:OPA family glycerol-3-phosphate transporter-like MFS transporter
MIKDRTLRWQGITLGTLFVGYAGYYVCRSNLSLTNSLIIKDLHGQGVTETNMGAIVSIGVALYAVGKISNGLLSDFLGGRTLFLLGMAASVVCTVLFGLGSGMLVFTIAWAANRYVQSMGWGALVKLAARWFPFRLHSTVLAVLCLSYLFGDGLVRLYLGYFIRRGLGWRAIFFIAAGTLGAIAVASWFLLKESPRAVGGQEPAANPDNLFGEAGASARPESLGRLLTPLLTNGVFWLVCVMNFGLTLIRETFNFWTPRYLDQVAGLSPGDAGLASSVFPFVGGFSVLIAGGISDRLQGKHGRVVLPALVILVGALWLLGSASMAGRPAMAVFLIGGVSFFLLGPYSFCSGVMALDLGGKRGSSTAAGLIDSAGYLGATLSGYGVGKLAQQYSWSAVFQALAGVAALTVVAALVYLILQEITPSKRALLLQAPETDMQTSRDAVIDRIFKLFHEHGDAAYIGEPVSQTEHALQAAWAAEKAGASSALIAAALLHDVGHLLHHLPEDCAEHGIDDRHEELGARWLARSFNPEVTEPIRLHVPAKRYLCATRPGYLEKLSEASLLSLKLQGGPFTPADVQEFLKNPHATAAVTLRLWDEEAKINGLETPALQHFRRYLKESLSSRPEEI